MPDMAVKRCYYEVLSVSRDASTGDIASAYRKLAIRYHPDSHPDDDEAVDRFKEAAEAYEVLSDEEKRARYDRFGHAGLEGAGATPGFHDVEDIFDAFGDLFGFGDMFGSRRRGARRRRGGHVQTEVVLDLEEVMRGAQKEVHFQRHAACTQCKGSGARPGSRPVNCHQCGGRGQVVQSAGILRVQTTCPTCRGSGRVVAEPCDACRGQGLQPEEVTLSVRIPAGVDDGMQVRLQGEGERSPQGGTPGDCYCVIRVRKHPLFERDGQNLFLQVPITYTQAVLGAEMDIPTMQGPRTLSIPPGTPSGHVFRLARFGVPSPQGGPTGELLVRTFIEVPTKIDKEQERILRELAELENTEVAPERRSFLERIRDYFVDAPEPKKEKSR